MKTLPALHSDVRISEDLTPAIETSMAALHTPSVTPVDQHLSQASGVLDITPEGFGLLRRERYLPGPGDIYVPASHIRRLALRPGDMLVCEARPAREHDQYSGLVRVETVNGLTPEDDRRRPHCDALPSISPREQFDLETDSANLSSRLI